MAQFEEGLRRSRAKETNNRTSSMAKGTMAATPKKSGAKRGFASNGTPPGGGRGRSKKR